MRAARSVAAAALAAALCLAAAGCITLGESPESRFYLLSTMSREDAVSTGTESRPIVGVGPMEVPEYLNRSQLVVRLGPNRLKLADFHKWAEPLKDGIARVLAGNLTRMLPVEAVYFPWRRSRAIDYQLTVQVARFDTDARGAATLDVRWGLWRQEGRELLVGRSDVYGIDARSEAWSDRVGTLSEALEAFSRDVAAALRENLR